MSATELAETLRRCSTLSAEESIELVDRLFAVLGRPSDRRPPLLGSDRQAIGHQPA